MIYYKAVEEDEHLLYAKEIAMIYENDLTSRKVTNIIKKYITENNIEYEQLYYETRNGLCKVYPRKIYRPAINWYLDNRR